MRQLEKDMAQSAKKIDSLKSKMNALNSVKTPTQEYKDVSKQIADAEKKQAALNDRMEKFVELGGKANSKQYKSMQYDAAELENTIAYAKGELQDLVDTGKAFTLGASTAEFNDLSQQLAEEQSHLNELSDQYSHLQSRMQNMSVWEGLITTFGKIRSAAKSVFLAPISGLKKATGAAKTLVKGLGSVANGFKRVASFGAKTVGALSGLSGISRLLGGTIGHLGKRILSLAKTAFIFGILRRAFTSLQTGVQESFGTYLNYDSALKTSINGLKAQLSALKGSLASAFAPIISAVVPYLSTLISWVTAAANAVAAFIATLSGKSSYKKAVANVEAVGAAADDTAGSLSDAKDAAEELEKTLGNYDDLKVIDQPDSSSSGSGSGGSGGSGSAGDITYEDVEIASAISDFAEKVKEAWRTADFTEVGAIIGEKLKDSLDNIPWGSIQEKASKVGSSLATFINGAIEVEGLGNSIGVTIGEAINTGIAGLKSLSGKLHWSNIGTFVSEGISGTLNTIEWNDLEAVANNLGSGLAAALNKIMTPETFGDVGTALGKSLNTVISGAYSFISTADWKGYGNAIATGINNFFNTFDWKKAGLTFSGAVRGIINTLTTAIQETSWSSVGNSIGSMIRAIDFKSLLLAVGTLIWEAIKAGIETWKGLFDEAPVETVIVTALLAMKFTGLGNLIGKKIFDLIAAQFVGTEAEVAAAAAAEGLSTTLAGAITTALTGTVIAGAIAAGVAFIYKGVKDMLADPDFLKNKDIEDYIKENPGALGEGAETPEIEIKITGDNEPLKESVNESAEYLNKNLPNETYVEVNAKTDNLEQKLKNLSTNAKITVSMSLNGLEPTMEQKLQVIAEVTGTDYSKLPVSEKYINDMYANITKAYAQSGVSVNAPMLATSLTNNGKSLLAPMDASKLSNNGQTVTAPMKANSLDSNGKTVTAPVKASKVSGDGKTLKAPIKASKITNPNSKTVSSKVKVTGFTNTPTLSARVQAVNSMWARNSAVGGIYKNSVWSNLPQKAMGGILQSNFWKNIPAYAAGGNPHGTMFVAGEAGPEIVGHIGGRTEVLNKSQIASAIYSAVSEAMREAINNLGYAILQNMAECTNMVIANMANIVDAIYRSGNLMSGRNVQLAGMPVDYTIPDTNRVSAINGSNAGAMTIDYDRLAGAVAKRISGNIEIQNNMTLDGRVIYDKMVSLNRAYIKQTGHSAFER